MTTLKKLLLTSQFLFLVACNLTVVNNGGGIVTSSSGKIQCGQECTVNAKALEEISSDSIETLIATPDDGFEFVGWTGDCSGTADCVITLSPFSGNKKVIAHFKEKPIGPLVVMGNGHICMQKNDSPLECWGSAVYGEAIIPDDINKVEALYSGSYHVCAQTELGLRCWGAGTANHIGRYYNFGQAIVPASVQFPSDVALGLNHSCAIENAQVTCWGSNEYGQTDVPEGIQNPTKIVAGDYHSCVIEDSGVTCWGAGTEAATDFEPSTGPQYGQSKVPDSITSPSLLTAGAEFTCAVQNNEITCWGKNNLGQIIVPKITGTITQIVAGSNHGCALADDKISCWGNLDSGQGNIPNGIKNVTTLTAGNLANCAYSESGLQCWGRNTGGQLNLPRTLKRQDRLALGYNKVCTLGEDGVHCWGTELPNEPLNDITDMSVGTRDLCFINAGTTSCYDFYLKPLEVPSSIATIAVDVESGFKHSCGRDAQGNVVCWGSNSSNFTTKAIIVPSDLGPVSKLGLGDDITCGLKPDGAYCWGDLDSQALQNPTAIEVERDHACALDDNGVNCWGSQSYGKLNVPLLTNPVDIAVGEAHSCALANEGVVCWGAGSKPETSGIGSYGQGIIPKDLVNPRDIDAALSNTCALDDIGIRCWGFRALRIITQ